MNSELKKKRKREREEIENMEGKKNRMKEGKKEGGEKWKEIGCTSDSLSSYLHTCLVPT